MKKILSIQKYVILGFSCFITLASSGQSENILRDTSFLESPRAVGYEYAPKLPVIIPPSPLAQSFMRYGNIPVGLSSGVPEITIPVYTLTANGLDIPINLSYHASGIKVSDVSSPVGLGWVMNAGGIITQTINGLSDDIGGWAFSSLSDAITQYTQDEQKYLGTRDVNLKWSSMLQEGCYNEGGVSKKTVSDHFFYSFNGNIGVFRKDIHSGELKTVPYSPIKINVIKDGAGSYNQIQLTDDEGRVWVFQKYETVFCAGSKYDRPTYEYYLERIKFPQTSDEVVFTYTRGSKYTMERRRQNVYFGYTPEYGFEYNQGLGKWYLNLNKDTQEKVEFSKHTTSVITPVLLSQIKWRNVTVAFSYSANRTDMQKERLTSIVVSQNGATVRSAIFDNSQYLGDKTTNYRMLLRGVTVNGESYSFAYNETKQPDYYAYAGANCMEDFWGYYNNANNARWVPFRWSWVGNPLNDSRISTPTYIAGIREPNFTYTQAGILKEIIYPTKGRTVFTYEPNNGTNVYSGIKPSQPTLDNFGGLRIRQIDNYDGTSLVGTKSYSYEGSPTVTLTPWHFYTNKTTYYTPVSYPISDVGSVGNFDLVPFITDNVLASSSGLYPLVHPYGPSHIYTKVTEYKGTSGSNAGKTEYNFTGSYCGTNFTCSTYSDYGMEAARMTSQKEYANNGGIYNLKKETNLEYVMVDKGLFTTGVGVIEKDDKTFGVSPKDIPGYYSIGGFSSYYYTSFAFTEYYAFRHLYLLSKKTEKEYTDNGGIIADVSTYTYDSQHRVLSPVAIQTTGSNGVSLTEKITHAFDYSSPAVYPSMVGKNMVAQEVQHAVYNSSNLSLPLKALRTDFKTNGGYIVTDYVSSASGSATLEKRIQYQVYDSYGNPIDVVSDNASRIVYLWGYQGMYPVAEIRNATYDEVKTALGKAPESISSSLTYDSSVDNLRTNSALKNAQVFIYKYKPLTGIISSTDPTGFTVYYDYDSYGRLIRKYFKEGSTDRVIETYTYNFRN